MAYHDYDFLERQFLSWPVLCAVLAAAALAAAVTAIVLLVKVVSLKRKLVEQAKDRENTGKAEETGKQLTGAVFCRQCGSRFESSVQVCPYCGAKR